MAKTYIIPNFVIKIPWTLVTITEIFSGVDQTTIVIVADVLKAGGADFNDFKACFPQHITA